MHTIPENNKRPGVLYCFTESGVELPVVDLTNPAFALGIDETTLPKFTEKQVNSMKNWSRAPSFLRAWFTRNSVLMGTSNQGGVLDGMTTYLYKLGPENLGSGYTKRMDRQVAANIMAVSVRLRFRDTVEMIAGALVTALEARDGPVYLLNLAGGTAMDSLNALIFVRKGSPYALIGRPIEIQVLEPDRAARVFAMRASAALSQDEQEPLYGLDLKLTYRGYDWTDASTLSSALRDLLRGGERKGAGRSSVKTEPVVVGSSEGGLFEYGSDDDILRNLEVLREETPSDFVIAGSALKDEPITRLMKKMSGTSFLPRTLEDLTGLVGRAGWKVNQAAVSNPVYHVVTLGKAGL
jgi:hypothetical protein